MPPGLKEHASQPNCNLILSPGAWAKSPGFLGETRTQQCQDSSKQDWDTVSVLEQLGAYEMSHHAIWARLLHSRKQVWGEGEAMTTALHEAVLLGLGVCLAKRSFCKHSLNNPRSQAAQPHLCRVEWWET